MPHTNAHHITAPASCPTSPLNRKAMPLKKRESRMQVARLTGFPQRASGGEGQVPAMPVVENLMTAAGNDARQSKRTHADTGCGAGFRAGRLCSLSGSLQQGQVGERRAHESRPLASYFQCAPSHTRCAPLVRLSSPPAPLNPSIRLRGRTLSDAPFN